jgi:NADP-dependent aldehyde dehydrogenase|tara:strand:+ start:3613 stop:5028 length:1416 start_codon:yes stop_codon:yes gene_type:complete
VNEAFPDATTAEVDMTLRAAAEAFHSFRKLSGESRATFLETIADILEQNTEEIISLADGETSLGLPRLGMELERTANETRLFAKLARSEDWRESHSDEAEPDRIPIPKPGLQSDNLPLGPVVVIGACNFPLAISVVGTDTMSALAVGCPVIVKAHPGHPGTCAKLGQIVKEAAMKTDMPSGTFSLLQGIDHRVSRELVEHPLTKAVAFTGSLKGGRALATIAAKRNEPIPFYAEMGSLNPIFILPGAIRERSEEIARGYVEAINLFAGQMCTKPGALVLIDEPGIENFLSKVTGSTRAKPPVAMLNRGIRENYETSTKTLAQKAELLAESETSPEISRNEATSRLFATEARSFIADPDLRAEAFGPTSLIIKAKDEKELLELARQLEGNLTASLHVGKSDKKLVDDLLPVLEQKAGRVLWNGFPPGVVPTQSTHHGGPWPATTDARHTSIGLYGYRRFVRQVCRQGFPKEA